MSTTFCFPFLAVVLQLHCSACNDVVVDLTRNLSNEGFHRDLKTTLIIRNQDIIRTKAGCSVLLIETLPPGLYVDTFQLESLAKMGGPKVLAEVPLDIEAPEYLSGHHEIYVFSPLPPETSTFADIFVTISLLIHVRYHKPSPDSERTYAQVVMYHPRVLLNCSTQEFRKVDAPCDGHTGSVCSWAEISYRSDTHYVELQIPIGHMHDARVVIFGTAVVIILGCSFLLYIIAFYDTWKIKTKGS